MTPGLVDDIYNSLIKIDPKFCGYLPHDANIDKNNNNYLPSNQDYSCIFKQFGTDYKKLKNLKCWDANMRKSLIETDYMSFVDMENKTADDDEWRLFFQRIPLTSDNINDQSMTPPSRGATLPATHSPVWHTSPLGQRRVSGPVSQASRHWPARQYIPVGHVTPLQSSVTQ